MNGWTPINYTLNPGQVVGASASNTPVSMPFSITAGGALNCVVAIQCSDVTSSTGLTLKLQTAIKNTWFDSKTATLSADGWVLIKLNVQTSADQTYLPLLDIGRVVLSTGSGDTATIQQVLILQQL